MKTFSLALISVGVMMLAHSLDVSGALARLGFVTLGTVLLWVGLDLHYHEKRPRPSARKTSATIPVARGNEHETD
jgi:uncharacterized membrane protein